LITYLKNHKITIILLFIILLFLFRDKIYLYIEITNFIDTKNNSSTIVAPVLDTKIILDKNIIYCATAQMAWNSLYNDVIKETIEIENQPWYVEKLNNLVNLPPQISQDAFVALSGFGKDDIIEKIKKELIKKFNEVPSIIKFPQVNPTDIIAFSYLKKILNFKEKYGTFYTDMIFNNKITKVKAFGYNNLSDRDQSASLKKQVKLLHYTRNSDFIMELITTSANDVCILSTLKPEDTLINTYNKIIALTSSGVELVNRDIETLVVPKINFDIEHAFEDIVGKNFKNINFKEYKISKAVQRILFKLNENGARIESYFIHSMEKGTPYKLKIKGPFTMFFKDKSATYPYFMIYCGNDELLER